jgi:beta-lactamase class A
MVYDYSRVSRIQNRRKKKGSPRQLVVFSFYFFICALVISGVVKLFFNNTAQKIISPAVATVQESVDNSLQGFSALFSIGLRNVVESSLNDADGTYSIYIKNLKTGEYYGKNENETYLSASLYKLWTMGAVYSQIQKGTLQKDDVLSADIEKLNDQFDIGTESAELSEGTIRKTVDDAVEQMITISHNYSALLLTSNIKLSTVRDFISTYDFNDSKVGSELPETTAADMGKYFELLYKKEIINDIYSDEMMARLKRQRLNDRIPELLPENTVVAHKTGELYGFKHDAGIVFAPKGDYVIVMMSDTKAPAQAVEQMAQLSKDVYDYFENQ